jgi:hypothetical protein
VVCPLNRDPDFYGIRALKSRWPCISAGLDVLVDFIGGDADIEQLPGN